MPQEPPFSGLFASFLAALAACAVLAPHVVSAQAMPAPPAQPPTAPIAPPPRAAPAPPEPEQPPAAAPQQEPNGPIRGQTGPPPQPILINGHWVPPPRNQQEAYYLYEHYSKNAGIAFALEFFLPSGGLFYTGRYAEAGFYWLGTITGVIAIVSAIPGPTESGGDLDSLRFGTGIALISVLRIGAMIYAPYIAMAHNDALRYHLGLMPGLQHGWPPGPAQGQPWPDASLHHRGRREMAGQADVHLSLLSLRF